MKNGKESAKGKRTLCKLEKTCCFEKYKTKTFFNNSLGNEENVSIRFYHMDGIDKGFLSKMWNKLFRIYKNQRCIY